MALNDALIRFVKDALERGLARDRIADALLRAGWPPDRVSTAMRSFAESDFPIPVPHPMPNVSAQAPWQVSRGSWRHGARRQCCPREATRP
jgi:hypothetical protein